MPSTHTDTTSRSRGRTRSTPPVCRAVHTSAGRRAGASAAPLLSGPRLAWPRAAVFLGPHPRFASLRPPFTQPHGRTRGGRSARAGAACSLRTVPAATPPAADRQAPLPRRWSRIPGARPRLSRQTQTHTRCCAVSSLSRPKGEGWGWSRSQAHYLSLSPTRQLLFDGGRAAARQTAARQTAARQTAATRGARRARGG